MKNLLLILFSIIFSLNVSAQDDVISWSSFQLDYVANDRLTLTLKPIVRQRDNLGSYDNSSIDFIAAYKIGKGWGAAILERHFFIPDAPDVEFIFFDLKKSFKSGNLNFNNSLRYHFVKGERRDFVRFHPSVSLNTNTKLTPFFTYEAWFNASINKLVGSRYYGGVKYKASPKVGLMLAYWKQEGYSDEAIAEHHNIVFNLQYILRHTTKQGN